MKRLLIALIKFYQKNLSPLKKHPTCKYVPTCSAYALQAIEIHGAFVGSMLAVWRVLRCNPFSKGGYDPVPQKKRKL
ncbi:MAG: membrane protein insertion efficiency factor YidD [Clostridia bacterium]|nr:membrane protein insertion efficiency factor YidD [Clostridia bacterium]